MHVIGIISDTHNLLRAEVKEQLKDCEMILHAGDITSEDLLNELRSVTQVIAVRGNGDRDWAADIPYERQEEVFGIRIFMTHKKKDIPEELPGVQLAVFGHSHKYEDQEKAGVRFLNPGSCGPRRWNQPITMAKMTVEDGKILEIARIDIPHEKTEQPAIKDQELLSKDPGKLVGRVVKELEKGSSSEKIAKKFSISSDLAENISRMYFTHPSVTIEGILQRLGL